MQGFWHLLLMHAKCDVQSLFKRHSGRQLGGLLKNPGRQEQTGRSLTSRQSELGPQGEGSQTSNGGGAKNKFKNIYKLKIKQI